MLNLSYKKFSAKKCIFQNFETNINFTLLEYHCLHLTICLTAKKFIQRMFGGTKTLSVNKIISKGWHFHWPISYKQGDMTCHHPAHLGQSSQGFNRSFKVQLTWGSPVKISTNLSKVQWTWGKYPSSSLGAFECQKCSTIPSSPVGIYSPDVLQTRLPFCHLS